MTAGSAASRRVLGWTPVAPLPASSPTRPTGITGRMSAPPETSSPGVCSFRLPQMCGFRLPLTIGAVRKQSLAGGQRCAKIHHLVPNGIPPRQPRFHAFGLLLRRGFRHLCHRFGRSVVDHDKCLHQFLLHVARYADAVAGAPIAPALPTSRRPSAICPA